MSIIVSTNRKLQLITDDRLNKKLPDKSEKMICVENQELKKLIIIDELLLRLSCFNNAYALTH